MKLFHKSDRKKIDAKLPHDEGARQNDTEKEHDKSSDLMNSVSSDIRSVKEEYDDAVAELMPVKWELVEKKSEISKIKSEYKQVLSELESTREELYHMRSELANIKSEIDSKREEIRIQSENVHHVSASIKP